MGSPLPALQAVRSCGSEAHLEVIDSDSDGDIKPGKKTLLLDQLLTSARQDRHLQEDVDRATRLNSLLLKSNEDWWNKLLSLQNEFDHGKGLIELLNKRNLSQEESHRLLRGKKQLLAKDYNDQHRDLCNTQAQLRTAEEPSAKLKQQLTQLRSQFADHGQHGTGVTPPGTAVHAPAFYDRSIQVTELAIRILVSQPDATRFFHLDSQSKTAPFKDLYTKYFPRTDALHQVDATATYWSEDGKCFWYWCSTHRRCHVATAKLFDLVLGGSDKAFLIFLVGQNDIQRVVDGSTNASESFGKFWNGTAWEKHRLRLSSAQAFLQHETAAAQRSQAKAAKRATKKSGAK